MTFPIPPRLTDADIALVESYLAKGGSPIQDFEMLDGFFAALVTGPEVVNPIGFLPTLIGADDPAIEPVIADLAEAQRLLEQVQNHWNRQVTTFMAGEPWGLWLREAEGPHQGRQWAEGFLIGMDQVDGWDRLTRRPEHGPLFYSVMTLANEASDDPELRPPPITPDAREAMLGAISYGLPELYAATRPGATGGGPSRGGSPRPKAARKARKPKGSKKTGPRRRR